MSRLDTDPDFEPRVADWLEADPDSAPAAVLGTVLAALPSISQRRAPRMPWRFPTMSSFAKVAIAAAAVVAVGTVGVIALRPGGTVNIGSAPSPSPTPTLAPTPTPASSAAAAPSPPPLTGSFTSSIHGISLSYPAGWSTTLATAPWEAGWPVFGDPSGDFLYDPSMEDHLFIVLASQPLAGRAADQWVTDALAQDDCGVGAPVTIDGASGRAGAACNSVAVTLDGRGYAIQLYTSSDEGWLEGVYDQSWFQEVLATVDLRPQDAVDAVPSPS